MRGFSIALYASFLVSVGAFARGQTSVTPSPYDQPPIVTKQPSPKYSKAGQDARIEGVVVLRGVVGTDGQPHDIKVVRTLGYGLDEEAVKCFEKWRFKPAKSGGVPVPLTINIEMKFQLDRS